jgi:hypothetical protein
VGVQRVGQLAVVLGVGLGSGSASANGRYPNADALIVDPGNSDHLVLRATFGTLVSADAGASWRWVCEEAVGYVDMDPAMTVLSGGDLLHGFLGNIVVSREEACSYGPLPFSADGRSFVDVTLDPVDPSRAWVLASGVQGRRQASLLRVGASVDAPIVVAEGFVPSTVEVSRSRPERMYVVGFDSSFVSTVMASDDRGTTWTAHPIALYSERPMYLSAIDPVNPDVLYVRVDDGTSDHLLVSRDGGLSFVDALTINGDMLGFALSPDGSQVAAGGPGDALHVAGTADLTFRRAASIQSLRCLTWAERGLFACAQENLDGWTVALSIDQGQSFVPRWHVQNLVPLACAAATSVGAVCERAWLDIASRIGADLVPDDGPAPPVRPPRDTGCGLSPSPGSSRRARSQLDLGSLALLGPALMALAARVRRRRR